MLMIINELYTFPSLSSDRTAQKITIQRDCVCITKNAVHTISHRLAGKMCLFFSYQCRSTTFPGCDLMTWNLFEATKRTWWYDITYLILLNPSVVNKSNIFVYVEMEKWSAFSARFGNDQVVKRKMLCSYNRSAHTHVSTIDSLTCGIIKSSFTYNRFSELTPRSSLNSCASSCFTSSKYFAIVVFFGILIQNERKRLIMK